MSDWSSDVCTSESQPSYGRDGRRHVDYDAVRACMRTVAAVARKRGFDAVPMPALGAGLGGGDWTVLEATISDTFVDVQPIVYLLDGQRPYIGRACMTEKRWEQR